ncbi:MAG: PAS domain S-box protein [Oceanococcaceae bacterium]
MLIVRLALLLSLLLPLWLLHAAGVSYASREQFDRMAVEADLLALEPSQVTAAVLARVARTHRLWAVEVRDRAGAPLSVWEDMPFARSGLLGGPSELRQPDTGALIRWWVTPARATSFVLGLLALSWLLLTVAALLRTHRLAASSVRGWAPSSSVVEGPVLRPRLRALLDATPVALLIADAAGRIRLVNRALQEQLGLPQAQLRGRQLENVISLQADDAPWPPAKDAPATGQVWQWQRPDGLRDVLLATVRIDAHYRLLALLDISATTRQRQSQGQRLGLLQHILDVLPVGVLVTDPSGRIQMANRHAERQFAWGPGELEGEELNKLMPVPFLNQPDIHLHDYRGQSSPDDDALPKVVGWRKDATTFPVGLTVEDLADDDSGYLVLIEDLTESLQTAAAQSRLGRLFEQTAEEVLILDARSLYVREANRGAQENLGYTLNQLRRMTLLHLAADLDSLTTEGQVARLRAGEQRELRLATMFTRADGSHYPVRLSLTCSREEEPPVLMLLAHDVTAQRAAENRLAWMSGHDTLTRLPNRNAANEELTRCEADAVRGELCVICIDGLRELNLRAGHEQGDELVATIAERLQRHYPQARLLARWSGATFLLVVTDTPAPPPPWESLTAAVELSSGIVVPQLRWGQAPLVGRAEPALRAALRALDSQRMTVDETASTPSGPSASS